MRSLVKFIPEPQRRQPVAVISSSEIPSAEGSSPACTLLKLSNASASAVIEPRSIARLIICCCLFTFSTFIRYVLMSSSLTR